MRIVVWLARAFLFFVLFAFALNNQHDAAIRWFFGYEWRTSMVFVVLAAFALGCVAGVLALRPSWWRHRRIARQAQVAPAAAPAPPPPNAGPASGFGVEPPREVL